MVFLDHRKNRTVGCFQSPVRIGAIKGTCIAVGTVLADKTPMTGLILLLTFNTDLVKMIRCRLDKIAYLLTLGKELDAI